MPGTVPCLLSYCPQSQACTRQMENNHTPALPLWELAGCGEGEHAGCHPGPGPAGSVTQSAVGEAWRPHHQTSAAASRECLWRAGGAPKGEHRFTSLALPQFTSKSYFCGCLDPLKSDVASTCLSFPSVKAGVTTR